MPHAAPFRKRFSPFHNQSTNYQRVPGFGPQPARCMLIGEKPGKEESLHRPPRPFVGASGRYLTQFLEVANVDRQSLYVTNLVKEFTEYSKPTAEEIARDHDELVCEILECDPEIIGLVGGWAVEHVLLRKPEMEKTHGCPLHVDNLFGGELTRDGGWIVLPMLHPAGALYSPDSMAVILSDVLALGQLMDGEIHPRVDEYLGREDYRQVSVDDLPALLPERANLTVTIDTEGTPTNPWSLQFTLQPGTGYLIRSHDTPAIQYFLAWLRRNRPTVIIHNLLYDAGMLLAMGIDITEFHVIDSMVEAYLLTIEPQSLKSLAYRHCAMLMSEYSEITAEASNRKALEYLDLVSCFDWPPAEPMVIIENGKAKIKKPQGISRRIANILADIAKDKRNKDDEPVDPRARWNDIDDYLKAPVIEMLEDMPTATLEDIDPEVAVNYACRDTDATYRVAPIVDAKIKDVDLVGIRDIDHAILPMIDRMQTVGIKLAPKQFWDDLEQRCFTQMDKAKFAIYTATGAEINPASGDQCAALLYDQLKLIPPKMTKKGIRGSTNDKCLENLMSTNPVVEHIMDYREADKVRGTYVVPLRRLSQIGDGRARANFRITRVSSGRLATSNPNLLAIPVRSDLGKQVRYGFVAPAGRILGDWDLSQVEMRVMAHESKDEKLCKVFYDDLDIHNMTASEMFSTPVDKVEKFQRNAAKQVGFGIINLISEHGLVDQMILYRATRKDGSRWTIQDCADMIREWFKIYPGVKRFHNRVIAEAQETGMTRESIGGRIRYVPGVWSPIDRVREEANRQACSHRIQSAAQSLMKRSMAVAWKYLRPLRPAVEPLLQIHDENLAEMDDRPSVKEDVNRIMVGAMSTTTKLIVPVLAEGGFGTSWATAH